MEKIVRKVVLESLISRKSPITIGDNKITLSNGECITPITKDIILSNKKFYDNKWGQITAETISFNILLTQNIDDMGIYLDIDYSDEEPNYTLLEEKYNELGLTFTEPLSHDFVFNEDLTEDQKLILRLRGQTVDDYYFSGDTVSAYTDTKLNTVKTYQRFNSYQIGLNLNNDPSSYFSGVLSISSGSTRYSIDSIISDVYNTGLQYNDTSNNRLIFNNLLNKNDVVPSTIVTFQSMGWNENNISLSGNVKEELDLGIVFPHEINNDVFIDRGLTSVFETQMRLSEIDNINQLVRYNNKFFNINQQY